MDCLKGHGRSLIFLSAILLVDTYLPLSRLASLVEILSFSHLEPPTTLSSLVGFRFEPSIFDQRLALSYVFIMFMHVYD